MSRRIVLLCLTLAMLEGLPVFAEAGQQEERQSVDRRIEWYTRKRNLGIGLTLGGAALGVLGSVLVFDALSYDGYDFDVAGYVWGYAAVIGGTAAFGIGVWQWLEGAAGKRLWEFKKGDLSLRIRGPGSAAPGSLGGLVLVIGY